MNRQFPYPKHVCGECGRRFLSRAAKSVHQNFNAHFDRSK